MSIDITPEISDRAKSVQSLPGLDTSRYTSRKRPWIRNVLLLVLSISALSAGVLIVSTASPDESGPKLTHTITRGDLEVTVIEQGLVESSENTEIKSRVRGKNAVLWIIESGSVVEKGDELLRLDSLFIREQIDERTKYAHWSRCAAESSAGRLANARLAVPEYEQGRYVAELMSMKKSLVVAEANLQNARDQLTHAEVMARSQYTSALEVEEKDFVVKQAELDVELNRTRLDVLEQFALKEQLQTLNGNLNSITATHEANVERAEADASRRDRALSEVEHCVVRAERDGLVIHPSAAKWESGPIAEGTNVWRDQVLLLMPDLTKMQVKVGIHESVVDRMTEQLPARVTLNGQTLPGHVSSVASVTRPASWWTGNEVTYDTLIAVPGGQGLMPGMSAEVEVIIAEYKDVLTIPVAAVVEADETPFCWVRTPEGVKRRPLRLGDSNSIFTIVEKGLREGDEVMLNPLGFGKPELAATAPDGSDGSQSDGSQSDGSQSDGSQNRRSDRD